MARSRLPFRVLAGGASRSIRACSSLSAGVRPSYTVAFGRFTPFTRLCTTALRSQRYSNSDETAESLRRIVEPSHPLLSRSLRQAIKYARVTTRNTSGLVIRANRIKSLRSFWYARRVCGFVMLAHHSISGGTSAALNARALVGIRARDDFFFDAMDGCGSGIKASVTSLTQTDFLWANMRLKIDSAFHRDKSPYHGEVYAHVGPLERGVMHTRPPRRRAVTPCCTRAYLQVAPHQIVVR